MTKRSRAWVRAAVGLALAGAGRPAAAGPAEAPAASEVESPAPAPPPNEPVGLSPRPGRILPKTAPAPPLAPPAGSPPASPVTAEFEYAEQWREGPFRVILLYGGVTIATNGHLLQADHVVGWAGAGAEAGDAPAADLDVVRRIDQIYAEGNVRLQREGRGTLMADRVFLDLRRNEGIFVEFRARTREPRTNQAIVIRAAEARQVSEDFFVAEHASITTCTYGTPHYDIVVRRLEFSRHPDAPGGLLAMQDLVPRINGVPLGYWPFFTYDLGEAFPLRRIAGGNTSRFGPTVLTRWGLPIQTEETGPDGQPRRDRHGRPVRTKWGEVLLDLDFRNERGWGTGIDLRYDVADSYQGFLDTYYLKDRGRNLDNDFDADLEAASPLRHDNRGRAHVFHRHRLDANWRLDVEGNYISDRDFLLEFFPREEREEKAPESYLSLRGLYDNWGVSLLERNTLNDWQEQVEYTPQAAAAGIAQALWPSVLPDLYYFVTAQADEVRWHRDFEAPPPPGPDDRIWRFDSTHEIWHPLRLGPLHLAPFVGARWSVFQETLADAGTQDRFVGYAGGRAEMQAQGIYRFDWDLAGMHDLRHVLSGEVRYTQNYACTVPSDELIPYDTVETADRFEEITFRLNQHFQTRVGPEGHREIVDFLQVYAALEMYPDRERDTTDARPQNSLSPFHWITLPPDPDGSTYSERRFSNLFLMAELTPRSRLSFRVDEEYSTRDRRPEVTGFTAQANLLDGMRVSAGYYMAHNVTETLRVTAYLQPTPRLNLYAQYAFDLYVREVTGRRFAAQWDLHDAYLEVWANFDPYRDEKQFLVGVSPKFGRGRSLFPHEKQTKTELPLTTEAGPDAGR